jgi:hypothetical protein
VGKPAERRFKGADHDGHIRPKASRARFA